MLDPSRFKIDWEPPDLTPALALFQAARNAHRQNDRGDEYLKLQREAQTASAERASHEVKRQEERDKHLREVESFNAMPMLQRAAMRSVGMANANPYGVKFDETRDLPANLEGPEASPEAEAARFAQPKAGVTPVQAAAPQAAPDFDRPHMPSPSPEMRGPQMAPSGYQGGGMDAFTDDARQRSADNVGLVGQGLQGPQPEQPLMMQAASNSFEPGPEGKRRIFANYQGNRFELPEQPETSGFGPKYDAIYQRALQEPGVTPEEAYRFVAKMAHDDTAEQGKNTRLTESLTQRNTNREDAQTFTAGQNELYRNEPTTAEEREKLARIRASAGNQFKQEGANDRMFSLLDRRAKAVRDTGLFGKLAANDKVVRGIAANLATGTEGLQHKDAQIQLARYFRQAQPTEGEMHLLYQNLGGWTDNFNQFKAKVLRGDLSPEQLRQMKKSAKTVLHEHEEDKKRFYQVARSGLGPGSGLDEVPDQAQKQFDMMAAELGIEPGQLPPLYQTEGGVTLGTKQAPKTKPRGTKKTELDTVEEALDRMLESGH